jgi:hypothetical protein
MDGAYIHILINHLPIILALVGTAAAVLALFLNKRALWLYAVATLTIAGLSVYPVFLTGKEAEESMEKMPYVNRRDIHDHEEAAELAMWVLLATGAVSAFAWWQATRGLNSRAYAPNAPVAPLWLRAAVAVGGLASSATISWAAKESDPILHYSPSLVHPPAIGIPANPPSALEVPAPQPALPANVRPPRRPGGGGPDSGGAGATGGGR